MRFCRTCAVAHAADLLSWFGHPNATDPEMHHLSRHMSSYLMYVTTFLTLSPSLFPPHNVRADTHLSSPLNSNFVANMDPNGPGRTSLLSSPLSACPSSLTLPSLFPLFTVRHWPQYGMDRRTLQLKRHNISIVHDDDRLEAMRFLNINNPIFAR